MEISKMGCLKCRKARYMKNITRATRANKTLCIQGTCSRCGRRYSRSLSKKIAGYQAFYDSLPTNESYYQGKGIKVPKGLPDPLYEELRHDYIHRVQKSHNVSMHDALNKYHDFIFGRES